MLPVRKTWLGLAALTLGLVLAPATVRAVDPKLLPNDTEWTFTVNLKQMIDSPLVKANRESLDQLLGMAAELAQGDGTAEKFLKEAGFDPMKDLTSLTIAGAAGIDPDRVMILLEGKFNAEKLHAAVEKQAQGAGDVVKITKVGGVKVYEIDVQGEKAVFASLVNDKTLIATASKEALSDAVARSAGTKKSMLKKEFRALLDTTSPKQSLSFVATGNALTTAAKNAPNIPNPDQVADALGEISGLSGTVTLAKDVDFQLTVGAKDAETAQQMSQLAQFSVGAFKAMVEKKADEDARAEIGADVLKTLKITSQANNVVFTGRLTVDVIERLFKNLGN